MDKTIIQEDDEGYTVLSTNQHVIGVLEEELQQLGINGVSARYGAIPSLEVPKDQGDDVEALDKENWLQSAIRDRRPSGFSNWETWCVVEYLQDDEQAPRDAVQIEKYIRSRQAPQAFYEVFAAKPVGDPKIVNWGEVAAALRD